MTLYFIIYAVSRARCFLFTFVFFSPQTEGVGSSGQPGQTEDARRLAHRAISYRPAMTMREPVIKPAMMMPPHAPVTRTHMVTSNNVHHGAVDRADSGIGGGSGSGSSPTTSLDMVTREVGGLNIQVRNIIVSGTCSQKRFYNV